MSVRVSNNASQQKVVLVKATQFGNNLLWHDESQGGVSLEFATDPLSTHLKHRQHDVL